MFGGRCVFSLRLSILLNSPDSLCPAFQESGKALQLERKCWPWTRSSNLPFCPLASSLNFPGLSFHLLLGANYTYLTQVFCEEYYLTRDNEFKSSLKIVQHYSNGKYCYFCYWVLTNSTPRVVTIGGRVLLLALCFVTALGIYLALDYRQDLQEETRA